MVFDFNDCTVTLDLVGDKSAGGEIATATVLHRQTGIEETRQVNVSNAPGPSPADAAKLEAIDAVKVQVEALP